MKDTETAISAEITPQQLRELERKNITSGQKIRKRAATILPVLAIVINLLEYNYIPNYGTNTCTHTYNIFLLILAGGFVLAFIVSLFRQEFYDKLAYKSAFFTVLFLLLTVYDYATLKQGWLMLPYFPWLDQILNAMIGDRVKLTECLLHSLNLLFTGFFEGVIAGLICGIGAGWSKKIYYWVYPVAKVLGAIPTTTYMPIILLLSASLFAGSTFIIALGVWFPVTLTSMTGVANVRKHFYEVAETLGTSKFGILLNWTIRDIEMRHNLHNIVIIYLRN